MADNFTFEWDKAGLEQLQEAVDAVPARIAPDIAADARRYAPKDTGRMSRTIRVEDGGQAGTARVVVGGGQVDYWADQEFGTEHQPGRAFMRPALNQRREIR